LQAVNRNEVNAILSPPPQPPNYNFTTSPLSPPSPHSQRQLPGSNVSVVETNDRKTMMWEGGG